MNELTAKPIKYLRGHFIQYLFILLLFALVVTALNSQMQLIVKLFTIVLSVLVYFFWSIWHHWEDHALTPSVVLEYLIICLILFWLLVNLSQQG